MLVPCIADAQTEGTPPWTIVTPGWAPEPDVGRGTMSIIWTCLVTIFACSWTVTHPDFPNTNRFAPDSKIWICVVAVLAPEVLANWAFNEYINVKNHAKALKQMSHGPWTMSQSFFVSMGGVQLEFKDCTETLGRWRGGDFDDRKASADLKRAMQLKFLDLSTISTEDVKSRAKTSYIVKALVCLQASWLVAQVIGRAVAKLPITTLEVVTTGYVVCALFTYVCWWHKPQDTEVFIKVDCRSLTKGEFYRQINDVDVQTREVSWREQAVVSIVTGAFGAVHCTAWNFIFATFTESVIWKVASVLTALLPSVAYIITGNMIMVENYDDLSRWLSYRTIFWAIVPLYVLIRLYLMIEPFVAFRSVPIGIFYTIPWASWIPHI